MRLYNKIADRLAGVGSDKYLHFLACQMISFLTAKIGGCFVPAGLAAITGLSVAVAVGLVKELWDRRQPGNAFSWSDIIADVMGAVTGAGMGCV